MPKKRLTDKQMNDICIESSKKTFRKMKKIIADELDTFFKNNDEMNTTDFINIVIRSLVLLDTNMILSIINHHNKETGNNIDLDKVVMWYFKSLSESFVSYQQKIKNEGLN